LRESSVSLRSRGSQGFRGHIAELDSIRAFGILLVLVNHLWPQKVFPFFFHLGQLGWIAMDAFFVMSGFLITGILVDTKSRPDYFRSYYLRRSLRIFPLYYAVLVVGVVMMKMAQGGAEYASFVHDWGSPLWFFVYLGDVRTAYMAMWPPFFAFVVLWSMQIEEQFYLLFPLAVRYLHVEQLERLLWCLVFLSPAFRIAFYLHNPNNLVIQNVLLPCRMEGLSLGGLMAIRFRCGPWEISKLRVALLTAVLLLAACLGSILSRPPKPNLAYLSTFNRLAGYSLSSWGCACLVLLLVLFRGSRYTRLLRTSRVAYVATISYGIYLLHPLVMRLVRPWEVKRVFLHPETVPRFFVVSMLTIIAATLSWFCFEGPMAKLKDRFMPKRIPDTMPYLTKEEIESPAPSLDALPVADEARAPLATSFLYTQQKFAQK
jgi:peptidoglycan/LPS O-acetylase OafA/YrhL